MSHSEDFVQMLLSGVISPTDAGEIITERVSELAKSDDTVGSLLGFYETFGLMASRSVKPGERFFETITRGAICHYARMITSLPDDHWESADIEDIVRSLDSPFVKIALLPNLDVARIMGDIHNAAISMYPDKRTAQNELFEIALSR